MGDWLYTLRERFTPASAEHWSDYVEFSGFKQIVELVTLDILMCPDAVTELREEDWDHNVHEDYRISLFRDPDYLIRRQPVDAARHQLLAIFEHPDGTESVPSGFTSCGYDIMDSCMGNSALTNCGPVPEAFDPTAVNTFGLLPDWKTAIEVRDRMRKLLPEDDHLGDCEVWTIARALPGRK